MDFLDKILDSDVKVGDIFSNGEENLKRDYRKLSKICHPDSNQDPRAVDAFQKLNQLYDKALDMIHKNIWEKSNYLEIKTKTNTTLKINYFYHHTFELGEYYVCDKHIIYLFDFNKKIYYNNYIKQINELKYEDKKMEDFYKKLFPAIEAEYDTNTSHIILISKPADVYPLRCFIDNVFKGDVPPKHLAWMITRLLNIGCFLKFNNLVNNGIEIDNLFVCPKFHSICLYGGWWFTTKEDETMIGTTKNIFNLMPPKVKSEKISKSITDIESIKAFGRAYQKDLPDDFKNFLNSGTLDNSVEELNKWDSALDKSFGERRFIKIKTTKQEIYNIKN